MEMPGSRLRTENKPDLLLIQPPYHRRIGSGRVFPIGLGYLASAAERDGFNVKILDCASYFDTLDLSSLQDLEQWLRKSLEEVAPRLAIGIGPCTTSSILGTERVAAACRQVNARIPLVFGGPLASLPGQTDLFFQKLSATAVVSGDGDQAICRILHALADGGDLSKVDGVSTPGRIAEVNVIEDLDGLPFPRRDEGNATKSYALSIRRELFADPFATVMASRGCPFRCAFCVSGHLRNGKYHRRSIENVASEIRYLQEYSGVRTVVFYDDTFLPNRRTIESDVAGVAEHFSRLPKSFYWQIELRPDVMSGVNGSLAAILFEAGCRQLNIGIEKGDSEKAKLIGKKIDIEQIGASIKNIRKGAPRMRLTGTFIVGGPEEDEASIRAQFAFAESLGLLFVHYYPLEVYPGTELYRKCFPSDGPLDWYDRIQKDNLPWGELVFESEDMGRDKLLDLVASGYRSFYGRDDWHNLAREFLGQNYSSVKSVVESWSSDRYGLQGRL